MPARPQRRRQDDAVPHAAGAVARRRAARCGSTAIRSPRCRAAAIAQARRATSAGARGLLPVHGARRRADGAHRAPVACSPRRQARHRASPTRPRDARASRSSPTTSTRAISGGERQLALIARALAQEPPLLVMDEPTASLDFGNQVRVLGDVRRSPRGHAVVLIDARSRPGVPVRRPRGAAARRAARAWARRPRRSRRRACARSTASRSTSSRSRVRRAGHARLRSLARSPRARRAIRAGRDDEGGARRRRLHVLGRSPARSLGGLDPDRLDVEVLVELLRARLRGRSRSSCSRRTAPRGPSPDSS